jgi:hypothetical protein
MFLNSQDILVSQFLFYRANNSPMPQYELYFKEQLMNTVESLHNIEASDTIFREFKVSLRNHNRLKNLNSFEI